MPGTFGNFVQSQDQSCQISFSETPLVDHVNNGLSQSSGSIIAECPRKYHVPNSTDTFEFPNKTIMFFCLALQKHCHGLRRSGRLLVRCHGVAPTWT